LSHRGEKIQLKNPELLRREEGEGIYYGLHGKDAEYADDNIEYFF
jgi:hypothetical protein